MKRVFALLTMIVSVTVNACVEPPALDEASETEAQALVTSFRSSDYFGSYTAESGAPATFRTMELSTKGVPNLLETYEYTAVLADGTSETGRWYASTYDASAQVFLTLYNQSSKIYRRAKVSSQNGLLTLSNEYLLEGYYTKVPGSGVGTCTRHVFAGQLSSGGVGSLCFSPDSVLDDSLGNKKGTLSYPCVGDGAASISFIDGYDNIPDPVFQGSVTGGKVVLQKMHVYDDLGCLWEVTETITGQIGSNSWAYSYAESPDKKACESKACGGWGNVTIR